MSANNRQFLVSQIIWMGVSIGISLTISMLVPFPISLVAIIGVFILLNFYMRKRMMRRIGMGGGRIGMFGSMSPSSMLGDSSLKYYCISCGTQHKQGSMSKMWFKDEKSGVVMCIVKYGARIRTL